MSSSAVETPNFSIYSEVSDHAQQDHIDRSDPFETEALFSGAPNLDGKGRLGRADYTSLPSVRFELGSITGRCSLDEWD